MTHRDNEAEFAAPPDDADYVCPSCGEVIVVPLDVSAGREQQYVEDCPVCCCPNQLTVTWGRDGSVTVTSQAE